MRPNPTLGTDEHAAQYRFSGIITIQSDEMHPILCRHPHGSTAIGSIPEDEVASRVQTHLVEPHVIPEVGIVVELRIAAISGTLAFHIAAEDVDNTVLYLLSNLHQVHIITAPLGAFDLSGCGQHHVRNVEGVKTCLKLIAIELVESLQALDEEEVDGQPCSMCEMLGEVR